MAKIKRIKLDERIDAWNSNNLDKRKKSRASVSESLGINYQSLSRLNSGEIGKGMQTLNSLAEELECTVDELIEKDDA